MILLAPGFSPVLNRRSQSSRFNGFSVIPKAAEAAAGAGCHDITGLMPGANESLIGPEGFENTH